MRQLGFASGVALMSAVLRTRIEANLLAPAASAGIVDPAEELIGSATLAAYADCFSMMAWAAIAVSPGILVFRAASPAEGSVVPNETAASVD